MGTPQIIMIVLLTISGILHLAYGEDFVSWMISCVILVGLLCWGGYFG